MAAGNIKSRQSNNPELVKRSQPGWKAIGLLLLMVSRIAYAQDSHYDKSVRHYRDNDLDKAIVHIDKAISLYSKQRNNDSLVFALSHKALVMVSKEGLQQGRQFMEKAMSLVEALPEKSLARVAAYSRIGQICVQQYQLSEAQYYFNKAEQAIHQQKPVNRHYVILYHAIAQLSLTRQQYRLAQDHIKKAYATNLEVEGKDGALMANIWQTRYFISFYNGDYNQAMLDGLEFQRVMSLHYHPDHPNTGMMHNSLSDLYHVLNLSEKALYHQHKAVDIHYNNYRKTGNGYTLAGAYSNLGGLYYALHEYYLANEYLTKAKNLLQDIFGEFGPAFIETLIMLGSTKQKLGLTTEAEKLFKHVYSLQQTHASPELSRKAYIESNFGDFYFDQRRFKEAIGYYDLAIDNYRQTGEENTYYSLYTKAYRGAALGYSNQGDKALQIHREVLDNFRRYLPQLKSSIISVLDDMSTTYRTMQRLNEALAYSDSVFLNILQLKRLPAKVADWVSRLPYSFRSCEFIRNRILLLQALYKQNKQPHYLKEVLEIIDSYGNFFSSQLYSFRSQASIIQQADLNKEIYAIGIASCWVLSGKGKNKVYTEKAFAYAERSKALLLRLASNNLLVDAASHKKDEIGIRDHDFRTRINSLNEQYLNSPNNNDSLLRLLTIVMEDYRLFQDSLKKSGVEPFAAKYDLTPYGIEAIRSKLLAKGQGLIQYAVTEESVFAFMVTPDQFRMQRIAIDVLENGKRLKNLHTLSEKEFSQPAYQLYQALVAPFASYLTGNTLYIIPDAELYYLSFELLITHQQERSFDRLPYLIRQYDISYLLSASSAIQFKEGYSRQSKNKALLFAPVFTDEMKADFRKALPAYEAEDEIYYFLDRQPFSLKMAKNISRFIANDLFAEHQAQEHVFKQWAGGYRILHFATHAEVNDLSPLQSRLFFAKAMPDDTTQTDDGYLHAYEIYALQLRAELAVLTACETGVGAWRNGEGVLSLAHSFMHAGCPSVVMSLWKIDEKTSADIVAKFYEYLSKGYSKSAALRKAKLYFMDNNREELSHPYYWAGLVLIGDNKSLYSGTNGWHWLALGAVGFTLIAVFFYWKFFPRKKELNAS